MREQDIFARFRRTPIAAAFMVAFVTACGGGGSGGSGSSDPESESSLSSEEQVALAAFNSGGTASTSSAAADKANDQDEEPQSQSQSMTGAITLSSDPITCNAGDWWIHEQSGGDFALDEVDFEQTGIFLGNASLQSGSDQQIRADDCRISHSGSGFSIESRTDGAIDNARVDLSGDRQIAYVAFGGYDGEDPEVPEKGDVDISEPYISEIESTSSDVSLRMRGEFWSCEGCLEHTTDSFVGDLGSVSGDPVRDVAIATRFEATFGNFTTAFGDVDGSADDLLTFVSRAKGSSGAEFVIDGRLAYSDEDRPQCTFDVTYSTDKSNPPFIEEYGNEGVIPTEGGFEITLNSGGGDTFDVDFDTGNPDTVRVNDNVYHRSDLVDDNDCAVDPEEL